MSDRHSLFPLLKPRARAGYTKARDCMAAIWPSVGENEVLQTGCRAQAIPIEILAVSAEEAAQSSTQNT